MSNQHYTQCPNCKAVYPIPSSKLGSQVARAKCGCCQQIFLLNDNRIASPVTTEQPNVDDHSDQPNNNPVPAPASHTDIIFDGADEPNPPTNPTSVAFSDSELNDFLNKEINVAQDTILAHNEKEDESWLQDLLKDSKPDQPSAEQTDNTKINEIDLFTIIPTANQNSQPKKTRSLNKVLAHKPTSQQLATKKPVGVQIMWFIGCVILLILLGVQYTIFNLDQLVRNPSYAPSVQKFCQLAKCSIPNADLSSLVIDATLKNHPQATDVIITIRNKSSDEQLYPNLLVRLRNKDGTVIADFVASSHNYLSESQTSILGNQSKRIMLTANTNQMPATVEVTPFY